MESRSNLFLIDHNNLIHSANSHEPSLMVCIVSHGPSPMDRGVDSHDQRGTTPIVVALLMCLSFGHRFRWEVFKMQSLKSISLMSLSHSFHTMEKTCSDA